MPSPRKMSMGSACVSEKRVSQWEDIMRKFSDAHKQKCRTTAVDIPREPRSVKYFPTGSQYTGTWDVLGMSGHGEYVFPNGVEYGGDFEEGMFHGVGELRYKSGAVIRGKFEKGVLIGRTLLFTDNLEYSESDWKYCVLPDRRFAVEYDLGLRAAGKAFQTANQPTKTIPHGYYDVGDGFYSPKAKCVFKYHDLTAIIRCPSDREHRWIIENCRGSFEEPVGPRSDLYEKWSEPVEHPEPPPPPAAGPKTTFTKFRPQSVFEDDLDFLKACKFFSPGSLSESSTNTNSD
ncbi:unnamed protein product [Chrysodeixis includens]|uniref:MORN repeat-containing protein 5 n=1 Tax=Chrysodeixis includens TaxID=689277 RepID=A0A9P0BRQ0_CHRIL|nr:unnamed protein product [Chrysodeixis includens]